MKTSVILDEQALVPSVQKFRLVVIRGPKPGAVFELSGGRTTVGKGDDSDVVIRDSTVSRSHFAIEEGEDGFLLLDLGSTNGTWLEGARIKEGYLRPGAQIRAGEVLLRFQPIAEAVNVEPSANLSFGAMVSRDERTREVFTLLEKVAPTKATILLIGETGTGKSEAARAIHSQSDRSEAPFVVFDCGAVSKTLVESELFGHEKGAFTGATRLRKGAMEAAHGGTLFIDELDDFPLELQPKLLRAMDEKIVYRVGSTKPVQFDVRIVAATKKDLRDEVAAGRFREDLYFRVSVVTVPMPPLRARPKDIEILVDHFLAQQGAYAALPPPVRERLTAHTWPGNLRELRNVLERASYTGEMDTIDPGAFRAVRRPDDDLFAIDLEAPFKEAKERLVARFEKEYLRQLIRRSGGNMARAARDAGIDRKYLYMLMKKHELSAKEDG